MSDSTLRLIPNLLTVARGVLAVLFFVALSLYRYPDAGVGWLWAAIGLFIVAAATDILDGHLARRWKVVTAFGRIMDPFCDKLLVMGAFMCMVGSGFVVPDWAREGRILVTATGLAPWMVVIMLARELFVTSIRGVAEARGVSFGAKWSGKAKMLVQSVSIPVVLTLVALWPPGAHLWAAWTIQITIWATIIVTIWSGLPYALSIPRLMTVRDDPA